MRTLAGHAPDRFERVLAWPVREGLLAFVEVLRQDARDDFQLRKLAFMIAGGKKPEPPALLRGHR